MSALETLAISGIVPVINIPDPSFAEPLADALTAGGLPQIEVTLRNDTALESIAAIKRHAPTMVVGAGTVLSVEQAKEALAAGADFIVCPGLNAKVVAYCVEHGVDVLPGCVTATEIEMGLAHGLSTFKFFPSESMGGVKTIEELCGPYSKIRFVPTNGINLGNLSSYLASNKVAAVGGSCMAPSSLVKARQWDAITALCKQAVTLSMGFFLKHIGINSGSPEEAERMARRFADIFDMPYVPGNRSDFGGSVVEACKLKFPGEAGHIAIGTNSVVRAKAYLERKGVEFREEFANFDKNGKPVCFYLKEEFGGFSVHIVNR